MAKLLKVKALNHNLRGQQVAGVAFGRLYLVNSKTNLLHLLTDGVPAAEAGAHPDDAAEWRGFPSSFDVEKRPPPPPPKGGKRKTPPPPPASGGPEDLGEPDSPPTGSSDAFEPSPGEVRAAELAAMTKTQLTAEAKALNIKGRTGMDTDELIAAIQVAEAE